MKDPIKLAALRAEIDSIDDAIVDLIERRLAASAAIAAAKGPGDDGLLKLRPRRQAEVIARVQARAGRFPPAALALIWRELMAHTLLAQARTEIVLCEAGAPERLEVEVRAHFGAAFPLSWAADRAETLRRARDEEAIAILAQPLAADEGDSLVVFDVVPGAAGETIAYAVGRVSPDEIAPQPPRRTSVASGEASVGTRTERRCEAD